MARLPEGLWLPNQTQQRYAHCRCHVFCVNSHTEQVRRIGDGTVIAGFAGATADAMTLLERLENKVEEYPSTFMHFYYIGRFVMDFAIPPAQLARACVELAKNWRTEKYLRQLEATILVADKDVSLEVTGAGDVIEPNDGIIGAYIRRAWKRAC